jgi:hypothetical protein
VIKTIPCALDNEYRFFDQFLEEPIGESSDRDNWFSVPWDTTAIENGVYQILGQMHVHIKEGSREVILCRQNIVDVKVENTD